MKDVFSKIPKVFILLLNWNNWHETEECLKSLEKVDYQNFEVIVVDNGSNERPPINPPTSPLAPLSPRSLGEAGLNKERGVGGEVAKRGRVELICNDTNLGFAGGNNVGIRYALAHGADYVLLLNNDAVAAPDFLTELMKAAESNPSFGILGSRIYAYGTNNIIFEGGKVNRWLTSGEHATCNMQYAIYKVVDYITGAAMLVKREMIEKIGMMREEYFLYYEDVDWCVRAKKTGYKCVLVPTSKVWHKVSATTKEGSPSYIYYHTRNSLMLAKFNGNCIQKTAAYILGAWILLKQLPKFLLVVSLPNHCADKRIWATSMIQGVGDFYRGKYGKYAYRN
ncbi:MAG: glycosyltransferase family 2 protein [Candidatus Spechtbacteria bacterium]|nr:glycosyltransferase family 2 protein [Candidatus Spechtbacteria bacterium]